MEEGTTTTPFDMLMLNDLDRFHLVMDVIDRVPGLAEREATLRQRMVDERLRLRAHTRATGADHPDITDLAVGHAIGGERAAPGGIDCGLCSLRATNHRTAAALALGRGEAGDSAMLEALGRLTGMEAVVLVVAEGGVGAVRASWPVDRAGAPADVGAARLLAAAGGSGGHELTASARDRRGDGGHAPRRPSRGPGRSGRRRAGAPGADRGDRLPPGREGRARPRRGRPRADGQPGRRRPRARAGARARRPADADRPVGARGAGRALRRPRRARRQPHRAGRVRHRRPRRGGAGRHRRPSRAGAACSAP